MPTARGKKTLSSAFSCEFLSLARGTNPKVLIQQSFQQFFLKMMILIPIISRPHLYTFDYVAKPLILYKKRVDTKVWELLTLALVSFSLLIENHSNVRLY